jgi:hypothetical protein
MVADPARLHTLAALEIATPSRGVASAPGGTLLAVAVQDASVRL